VLDDISSSAQPAILHDTFQIIVIDVGCLTNNRRYNSGCRLLGNFQEGSRKVLKFDTLVFQYNYDYFVFHLYGTPFCIDAALMEMSMAIILHQCIATTQFHLYGTPFLYWCSSYGNVDGNYFVSVYCHNPMPTFTFRPSKIFIVNNNAHFVFHLYGTPFCIDAALMEISMAIILYQYRHYENFFFANQYRHYEKFLLISEMQYGNGFCLIANFCVKCSMEMVFD
jgi:hypothetical protein